MTILNCPESNKLSNYSLGRVDEQTAVAIEEHLESCDHCSHTVDNLATDSDTLVKWLKIQPTEDQYTRESTCQRVEQLVKQIGKDVSPSPSASKFPAESLGQYQLLSKLGEGGMGTVYKALHEKLERIVALKVLRSSRIKDDFAIERFEREMRAVGRLDHQHIVRATDAGEANGDHFLVMELLNGSDLSTISKCQDQLRIADACELIRQAALGLQEAHEHGMVHRDLKPSNLMLTFPKTGTPTVKILDLGLALLSEDSVDGELTSEHQLMGTLDYMSPEQAGGAHSVDIRSDIYSLGATLYKLLTGNVPISTSNSKSLLNKLSSITTNKPTPSSEYRSDIPEGLNSILERMLEKTPDLRFQTPSEVAQALSPFCVNQDLAALTLDPLPTPSRSEETEDQTTSDSATGTGKCSKYEPTLIQNEIPSDSERIPKSKVVARILIAALLIVSGLGIAFSPIVFSTEHGKIVVEINDPNITVQANNHQLVISNKNSGDEFQITPGEHELIVERGDFNFTTDQFTVRKGETVVISIELIKDEIRVTNTTEKNTIGASRLSQRPSVLVVDSQEKIQAAVEWILSNGGVVRANEKLVKDIENLPTQIGELKISMIDSPAVNYPQFSLLRGIPEITEFEAYSTRKEFKGVRTSALDVISSLSGLTVLQLSLGQNNTNEELRFITELNRLENLGLFHSGPGDGSCYNDELLQLIGQNTRLKSLFIGSTFGTPATFTDKGLAHLSELSKIQNLALRGNKFTDDGLGACLAKMTNLRNLHIETSNPNVQGQFLSAIADLDKLADLRLALKNLEESHLERLNNAKNLARLKLVSTTNVTGQFLTKFVDVESLRFLDLTGTSITDDELANLARLPGLEQIALKGNPLITDKGIETFKANRPQVKLIFQGNSNDSNSRPTR